jgi:hypothetical protein
VARLKTYRRGRRIGGGLSVRSPSRGRAPVTGCVEDYRPEAMRHVRRPVTTSWAASGKRAPSCAERARAACGPRPARVRREGAAAQARHVALAVRQGVSASASPRCRAGNRAAAVPKARRACCSR